MSRKKRILFVSALDFKEKSIQVIRKTPEAFVKAGWEVDYLLARDQAQTGNYFYEKEFDPNGVNVTRIYWKFDGVRNNTKGTLHTVATKLVAYNTAWRLSKKAEEMVRTKKYDIVYGYELHGVLAVSRLRRKKLISVDQVISRFQGTWLALYYLQNNKKKLALNREAIMALKQPSSLCIMTNDGTQGDLAMEKLGDLSAQKKFVFWTNGVDEQKLPPSEYQDLVLKYKPQDEFVFLTVSRLESWKRLDRAVDCFAKAIELKPDLNARLVIVGEGGERKTLEKRASDAGVGDRVFFTGGVSHAEVKKYLNMADAFVSMYDLSNVGNPLLEAIRANKVIFTLKNGDTASWIKDGQNGFIYPVDEHLVNSAATDFARIVGDTDLQQRLIEGVKQTESEKLWTWDERFKAEVNAVNQVYESQSNH